MELYWHISSNMHSSPCSGQGVWGVSADYCHCHSQLCSINSFALLFVWGLLLVHFQLLPCFEKWGLESSQQISTLLGDREAVLLQCSPKLWHELKTGLLPAVLCGEVHEHLSTVTLLFHSLGWQKSGPWAAHIDTAQELGLLFAPEQREGNRGIKSHEHFLLPTNSSLLNAQKGMEREGKPSSSHPKQELAVTWAETDHASSSTNSVPARRPEMDCDKVLALGHTWNYIQRQSEPQVLRGRELGLAKSALTNCSKEQYPWPGCNSFEKGWEFPALQRLCRRQCLAWRQTQIWQTYYCCTKMAQPSRVCQDLFLSFIAAAVWWQVKVPTVFSDI